VAATNSVFCVYGIFLSSFSYYCHQDTLSGLFFLPVFFLASVIRDAAEADTSREVQKRTRQFHW